jgi:hypothetical protein
MKTKHAMLGAILAAAFLPALGADFDADAQGQQPAPGAERFRHVQVRTFGPMHIGGRKVVKNAPYSAEMVNERVQTLADGNQISTRHTSATYRDSQGRTRYENRDAKGEVASISIHDPAQGVTWVLQPRDKTAVKLALSDFAPNVEAAMAAAEAGRAAAQAGRAAAEAGRAAGEAARVRIEQLRKEGKLPTVERRQGPDGEEIVIKRMREFEDGKGEIKRDVRVHVESVLANAVGDRKWAANTTTKDLGTRDMGGVKAQGTLRSYEIPAGAIGNRNPIVVSEENWTSPDLQVSVYSKHSDPRSGDVVFRLENIRREEPAAALFTVPSDYTVKDPLGKPGQREKAQ